jgi:hypothetical protein
MRGSNVLKNKNFYAKLSLARPEITRENSKNRQRIHLIQNKCKVKLFFTNNRA